MAEIDVATFETFEDLIPALELNKSILSVNDFKKLLKFICYPQMTDPQFIDTTKEEDSLRFKCLHHLVTMCNMTSTIGMVNTASSFFITVAWDTGCGIMSNDRHPLLSTYFSNLAKITIALIRFHTKPEEPIETKLSLQTHWLINAYRLIQTTNMKTSNLPVERKTLVYKQANLDRFLFMVDKECRPFFDVILSRKHALLTEQAATYPALRETFSPVSETTVKIMNNEETNHAGDLVVFNTNLDPYGTMPRRLIATSTIYETIVINVEGEDDAEFNRRLDRVSAAEGNELRQLSEALEITTT